MKNAPRQTYMGLTLYKPDIAELASIFHTYFQHVEIFIDDILVLNSSQLDAYHPEYQAKTLLIRGLYQEMTTGGEHEFRSEEEPTATEVRVPPLGEAIVDATIASWLKRQGDSVQRGEGLVVLETDKANVEFPADQSGILQKIIKQAGDAVAVGDVLCLVDQGAWPRNGTIVEIKAGRRDVTVVGLPGKGKQLPPAAQQITQFFTERTSKVFNLLLLAAVFGSISVPVQEVAQAIQNHLLSSLDVFSGALLSVLPRSFL